MRLRSGRLYTDAGSAGVGARRKRAKGNPSEVVKASAQPKPDLAREWA
jgi:hypothetical protein